MKPAEYQRMFEVEATHWWYAGMRQILGVLVDSVAADGPARPRILDAGCGTGLNLSELGDEAVGVDVSEEALRFCRTRGLTNTVRASVEALPFADGSFDRVFALDVLSHSGVGDDRLATRELARVLGPNGLLVVRVPALELLRRAHDEAVHTGRRYARRELVGLLQSAGLSVLRVTYCNSLLLPLLALRALSDRSRASPPGSDLAPLPHVVEAAFRRCLDVEARLLRHGDLPLGASLVALARKP